MYKFSLFKNEGTYGYIGLQFLKIVKNFLTKNGNYPQDDAASDSGLKNEIFPVYGVPNLILIVRNGFQFSP